MKGARQPGAKTISRDGVTGRGTKPRKDAPGVILANGTSAWMGRKDGLRWILRPDGGNGA